MILKPLFILLLIILPSASIAEEKEVSLVEHTLMSHLMSLQAGLIYDEICNQNDPALRLDFERPENANLYGTLEMITSRLDQTMGVEPDKETSTENVINHYLAITAEAAKPVRDGLLRYNCDNQNARNAEQSFNYYFNTHPSQIHTTIDDQIKASDNKEEQE